MTKVMVVEDDNSLKEIYTIRLTAEGYEVVSAADGEEALAVAVREKPDLILSDVMMPKISGFDMLDILRQTPETKNIKVIMMTALSSDDQRARGENLGADKYLVKSQVGIEDVINSIHEVLSDKTVATPAAQAVETVAAQEPAAAPVAPEAQPTPDPVAPAPEPAAAPVPPTVQEPAPAPEAQPATPAVPAPEAPAAPTIPAAPVEAPVAAPIEQPAVPVEAPAVPPVPPVPPVAPENEAQNGIPQA